MSASIALYRLYSDEGVLLYIGTAKNPLRRWLEHADSKEWWDEVHTFRTEWHPSLEHARAAERSAIHAERPRYNVVHSIDRSRTRLVPLDPARTEVSITEAAQLLDVSRQRVHALIVNGKLPAERLGSQWIIQRAAVDRRLLEKLGSSP